MGEFIRIYAAKKGVSESFCYKILSKLKELTIVTLSDHYQEYHLNMERWKRDKKALDGFKAQIKDWEKSNH